MKKMIKYFTLLIVILIMCSGCEEEKNSELTKKKNENALYCTKETSAKDNMSTSLKYTIYYKGEYVTRTVSIEKVISDDNNILEKYKTAYENVFKAYQNIDYYDNKVEKLGNSVTSTTVINYEKVDTKRLLEIEGEEGNVFDSNGKVKKDTLVNLYKKYGAKCE